MKLFVAGRVYALSEKRELVGNYSERSPISLVITGFADPVSYDRQLHQYDLFDLKTEIERVLKRLQLDNWDFISYDSSRIYNQSLKLTLNGMDVGVAGRVGDKLLEKFSISQHLFFAELDLLQITSVNTQTKKFRSLPKFPFASIDLSFIVDSNVPVGNMTSSVKGVAGKMFRDISIFDLYTGKGIPEGQKSVAFNVVLGSDDRTLNDEDVAEFINEAETQLGREYSATLRRQKNR